MTESTLPRAENAEIRDTKSPVESMAASAAAISMKSTAYGSRSAYEMSQRDGPSATLTKQRARNSLLC
jgi:hypothetical protein